MTSRKGIRRHIRLKDFGAGAVITKAPDDAYLRAANSSLTPDSFVLTTDENGFVIDPDCREGADAPVYVFGDSLVESTFIRQGRRFCDRLTRKMAADGHPRQFLNGGYSGATSLILLNTMINKVGCRDNSAVLLVLPSNDTLALGQKGGFWNYASPRYSPILPTTGEAVQTCPVAENLHQLKRVLKSFAATARSFSLDLYFATTPFMQADYEDEPWHQARYARTPGRYGRLIASRKRSNQVMRDVADRAGVPLVDLERLLNDAALFYDDLHVNDKGSAVLADVIHAQIGDRLKSSADARGRADRPPLRPLSGDPA